MKTRSKLLSGALIAVMLGGSAMSAYAATNATDPAAKATAKTEQTAAQDPGYATQTGMIRTADEAFKALRDVHLARMAISKDDQETAKMRVDAALALFDKSEKDWNDLTIGDTEDPSNADRLLPIDVSMSLGETFVPGEATGDALKTATAQLQSGQHDAALNTLRVAEIDVNVSAAMLPIAATHQALQDASNALANGDMTAADQALAKLGDAIVVRSFSIDGIPQQQAVKTSADAGAKNTAPVSEEHAQSEATAAMADQPTDGS